MNKAFRRELAHPHWVQKHVHTEDNKKTERLDFKAHHVKPESTVFLL